MKLLNKTIKTVLIFSLIITFNITKAQQLPDSLNTAKKRASILTKKMVLKLNLSKNQLVKVDSINLVYANIIEIEVIKSSKNKLSKYFKMNQILKQKDAYLINILNKHQFKIYEVMRDTALKNIRKNAF
jgi:hypothetical protein